MTDMGSNRGGNKVARVLEKIFPVVGVGATIFALGILAVLLVDVFTDGWHRVGWDFLNSFPSRRAAKAGILPAWVGTVWVMVITGLLTFPLGVAAATYLEEYAKKGPFRDLIDINIANLAGVPSIIYGILGLALFVRLMDLGQSILAGAFTLTMLVLPIVILATREALQAVPPSIREASYALGATKWQTVRYHVLPSAMPSILTGVILAMSRAVGETAPLVLVGALSYIAFLPTSPISTEPPFISGEGFLDPFTVLPIQIYNWVSRPQKGFLDNAAAGIIVLLIITFIMNGVAIYLRNKYKKKIRW